MLRLDLTGHSGVVVGLFSPRRLHQQRNGSTRAACWITLASN